MPNNFKERFLSEIDMPDNFSMVMKYNQYRNDDRYNSIVFVEGYSDKVFYENTKYECLNSNVQYIFKSNKNEDSINLVGKEAVIYVYDRIKRNDTLVFDLYKCIFIVDRDFDEILCSKYIKLKESDRKLFTLTKGHSMENFFLEEQNINKIFCSFDLTSDAAKTFWKLFLIFSEEIYEFYALKGTITAGIRENMNVHYTKRYDDSEIFTFTFDSINEYKYNRLYLEEEVSIMKNGIKQSKQAIDFFDMLKEKLMQYSGFLRGHTVFDFLNSYLEQCYGKTINYKNERTNYCKIVNHMNVEIDIKQIMN